jgi:hypothetical protein
MFPHLQTLKAILARIGGNGRDGRDVTGYENYSRVHAGKPVFYLGPAAPREPYLRALRYKMV